MKESSPRRKEGGKIGRERVVGEKAAKKIRGIGRKPARRWSEKEMA